MYKGLLFIAISIMSTVARAGDKSGTQELIGACAANYDKLQSWQIRSIQAIQSRGTWGETQLTHAYDIRFGGNCVSVRWREWGRLSPGAPLLSQEQANYRSFSWYGDRYVNYGRGSDPNDSGIGVIDAHPRDRDVKSLLYANPCSSIGGFFCQGTTDRIDTALRQARTIAMRDKLEAVNGVGCYVVDANGSDGNITAWIDPEHGHSIAKVRQQRTDAEGHLSYSEPLHAVEITFTFEAKRFDTFDGVWVPVEFDWTVHTQYTKSKYNDEQRHVDVQEVILNPEKKGLGKLGPDDIRERADVWIPPATQIRHIWRSGKPIAQIDEGVVAELNGTLEKMLRPKSGGPDPNRAGSDSQVEKAPGSGAKGERHHCGLYCLYSVLRLVGQKLDYRELVKPEYYGSYNGSSLAELRQCATDYNFHSEVVQRLSLRALQGCPYLVILHVKPDAEAREYNHYELFLGTESGRAKVLNPPEAPKLVPFAELASLWDGAGLVLSPYPLNVDRILTRDRQRLLLYGIIGVLTLLSLHVGRLIWARFTGAMSQGKRIKLTLGQGAGIGLAALIFGVAYHVISDEALVANASATASVQKAYAGTFIPKISAAETRRLLGADAIFIDARFVSDYEMGHIDGAINLPVDANDRLWKERTPLIPRGKRIVVYCQSFACKFAENVSLRLMKDGFTGISIFRGGWNEWAARNGDAANEGTKGKESNGGHAWIPKRGLIFKS
jgi:rhodanese-related sulfurtransferase